MAQNDLKFNRESEKGDRSAKITPTIKMGRPVPFPLQGDYCFILRYRFDLFLNLIHEIIRSKNTFTR